MSSESAMSLMGGMFSRTQTPPTNTVAKTMGSAAFFMPLIGTSPIRGFPPSMMSLFAIVSLSAESVPTPHDVMTVDS